jgi:heme/copper-type cytochrome/quinol oxidase subunit 3
MVIPMFLAALGGFVAAISGGVYAVMAIRRGDRSAILALPLIAFLLALTFIVGEFAVPH